MLWNNIWTHNSLKFDESVWIVFCIVNNCFATNITCRIFFGSHVWHKGRLDVWENKEFHCINKRIFVVFREIFLEYDCFFCHLTYSVKANSQNSVVIRNVLNSTIFWKFKIINWNRNVCLSWFFLCENKCYFSWIFCINSCSTLRWRSFSASNKIRVVKPIVVVRICVWSSDIAYNSDWNDFCKAKIWSYVKLQTCITSECANNFQCVISKHKLVIIFNWDIEFQQIIQVNIPCFCIKVCAEISLATLISIHCNFRFVWC